MVFSSLAAVALPDRARLLGGAADNGAIVGFDGTVYLDSLHAHNVLEVDTPQGPCRASFDFHKEGDSIPLIGPLTCRKDTSQ